MSASTPASLRVYFVDHGGRVSGILMRTHERPFDKPTPSAIAASEDDVLAELETLLVERIASGDDSLDRYSWTEPFSTREVAVSVHPQAAVKKRMVIGKKDIPLRLTYVWSEMAAGGYRVMLPRFGWWFVLEELSLAAEVLRGAVATALLGESARSIYDFRQDGEEYVREWTPRSLDARAASAPMREHAMPTTMAVCEDLVEKAARGKLGVIVGECEPLERNRALFDRDPLPSLLFVGGPGVGKTTLVRRMARLFAERRRSDKNASVPRIWSTSADRIIAGMVYVGMWQKRCLDLVRELAHEGDFLHVDHLGAILREQPDGSSIGELLLPAIKDESLALIAECTDDELDLCRRRAPALVAAMHVVRIDETPAHRVPELLAAYQEKRGVAMHAAALKRATQHLAAFQKDLLFPGKAARFVDWLAKSGGGTPSTVLFPSDVSDAYARYSGLPIELVSDERPASAHDLSAQLKKGVVGQDHACDVAARVLARLKAGLQDPERPCGTLLFVGPTGVGKTELAKQIARFLFGDASRMVRVDMSEYMRAGSSARLLASGDRGGEGASLAAAVRRQPLSLVLLDEIEKAHPEVFDLLLGVLGEGRLADEHGRFVDFRMTVIVMTSNLGATDAAPLGFASRPTADYAAAVRAHFRPELVNRIDHIVSFRALAPEDLAKIVDLALAEVASRAGLVRRKLALDVTAGARARLAAIGWHPTRGARPLKRAIEEHVVAPVAALLARDPALEDTSIFVDVDIGPSADGFTVTPRARTRSR